MIFRWSLVCCWIVDRYFFPYYWYYEKGTSWYSLALSLQFFVYLFFQLQLDNHFNSDDNKKKLQHYQKLAITKQCQWTKTISIRIILSKSRFLLQFIFGTYEHIFSVCQKQKVEKKFGAYDSVHDLPFRWN